MTLRSVPDALQGQLVTVLHADLLDFEFSSGGCINNAGRLKTSAGDFFLKWNDRERFRGMFEAEAKGLRLLRAPSCITIPEVVTASETGAHQFLVLEFIDEKPKATAFWKQLGDQLATLHRNSHTDYGLDHDNFIGSLQQINTPAKDWITFFITQRLEPQLQLAMDSGRAGKEVAQRFGILFNKLPDILPSEKPSLLHGDLWSGNLITNSSGSPCLIDPAVYYGNREAEIAFTRLFGGFSKEFYDSYQRNFPLFPGFSERSDVYNLYPLLVHVNLFGGGYLTQVVSILRHFV